MGFLMENLVRTNFATRTRFNVLIVFIIIVIHNSIQLQGNRLNVYFSY